MSSRHAFFARFGARRRASALAGLAALALLTAGCTGAEGTTSPAAGGGTTGSATPTSAPEAAIDMAIEDGARDVPVDEVVELSVTAGTLEKVVVRGGEGRIAGSLSQGDTAWTATDRLEPGERYQVNAVAVNADGVRTKQRTSFRTVDLSLDQQTFPSIAPLEGETVGVGMPVIIKFDVPVTDRASIEKHLSVETSPRQKGAWSWLNDHEVHWRPKTFWKPGTEVTVNADVNSVPAGNGIYGQLSRSTTFSIGDALVSKVNVAKHQMKVFQNGTLLRTLPVTAGKDGFVTRSGTKVIMEKVRHKTMDAATIGIAKSDPEYYNLDVEYAMRVTYSGEFIHGAPWSAGSQGSDNVSHGCVGMSMSDAAWLFGISKRGDVVKVSGTDRTLEPGNGYTDWEVSFAEFREGSALS